MRSSAEIAIEAEGYVPFTATWTHPLAKFLA